MRRLLLIAFLALSACSSCFGANAYVQKILKTQAAAATTVVTFAGAVTAGDLIAVGIVNDSVGAISGIQDQAANAYTVIGPCTNSGTTWVAYRANVPGTGAGGTAITVSWSTQGGNQSVWAREFSGLATSSPVDVSSAASCTGTGTTINLPSITPTQTGDLLYAVTYTGGNVTATGGSWAATDSNIQNGECDEYTLSGTTSLTTVNWASSSAAWAAVIISFKTAAAGGASPKASVGGKALLGGKVVIGP